MKPRIGYINLHVHDVDREVAFFRDVVGLDVLFSDASFHFTRFDAGIGFAVAGGGEPAPAEPLPDRLSGIGFVVEDVDAKAAEMKTKGARFTMEPSRQPWGGYMAMFADPEGNIFYLDGGS
ncbi:MAG TPA: VOC family protein [Caulobacteraceae bacterium]|nr:VOC family protein [Caulobacteraceae bacterium]